MMVDQHVAREAFDSHEIAEIGWVNPERNVAYAVTKQLPFSPLMDLIFLHRLEVLALWWVSRETTPAGGANKATREMTALRTTSEDQLPWTLGY